MTSLAHQLKRLALPQTDSSLLSRRECPSLLFDPKEAASVDRSTFYALGCTGLEELLGVEPALQEFQETLFSHASLTMERAVQSKDVNQRLDAAISLFLTRLSPYFLLRPAHKCIEWLLHRFHVHLYNADSLLACALPYHRTNAFVRVLQLLRIRDATGRWNWLRCLQKPGVPLSRAALVSHCVSDLGFLDFICSMVCSSVQAFPGRAGSCPQLRVTFSFYASTVVSALDSAPDVSDAMAAKLLPHVQRGLKSRLQDYKAASYMIVCQLAAAATLEDALVDGLALAVAKSLLKEPVLDKEGVSSLIVLLQKQREGAVGPRALDLLCAVTALVPTLREVAAAHDVAPLLRHLLPHLVRQAFSGSGEESAAALGVLTSVLESVPLAGRLDGTLARMLLDHFLQQTHLTEENMAALQQRLLPLVRVFESRYCGALDGVLAAHVSDAGDEQRKRLFHQFLSLSMSSGKYQLLGDSDTSLLLSLQHPQAALRAAALEHLLGLVSAPNQQSLDEDFLKDAVTERVKDEVPEVVAAALKVMEVRLDVLDPEETLSTLTSLLFRVDLCEGPHWLPVLTAAVRLMSDGRLGRGGAEPLQRCGWRLLPLLVTTSSAPDSAQLRLASCLARSPALAQHPLAFSWAQEMDQAVKSSSGPGFLGLMNQQLVSCLSRNLFNMEHFCRRDALEKLVGAVEQSGGGRSFDPRERTSFLVLARVLLLGLDRLKETQHLLTAHKLLLLLERPLLELLEPAGAEPLPQEAEDPGPAPFAEALGLYLRGCEWQPGFRLDAEFSRVLFSLLRDFISALKCDDASFKGELWWNPEKMDANTCCYLGLICRVFGLVLAGAGGGPAAASCRDLTRLLLQVHLREPLTLFKFLCVLWGYGGNQGDQLDLKVTAVLQTRALYVGGAVLSAQPPAVLAELAGSASPVVPSLLCCVSSEVRAVRRAALDVLQRLSPTESSPFRPITEKLLKHREELVADAAYLSTVLGGLHEEDAASVEPLLRSVQTSSCPSYSAAALLRALSRVHGQSVLAALLPVLERLLELSGPDTPAPLRDEARLLRLVLGKYDCHSAAMLARDQNCLDLFVRALRTSAPHADAPGCQIAALEQVTKSFFSALEDQRVQQKLLSVLFDVLLETRCPLVADAVGAAFKGLAVDGELVANELSPPEKPRVGVSVQRTRRSKMSLRKPPEREGACPEGACPERGAVPWQRVTLVLELLQHKKKLKRAHALAPVLFSLLARSLEAGPEEHANMEYTKQLLLGCLLNVVNKLPPHADVLEEDKFNVELVVQVIRASDVPQTHHHALLLLGAAAAVFPEKVLHNIMSIFTFMGANVLRLDDAYSFAVIDKTLRTVVPALLQAHGLQEGEAAPARLNATVTRMVHVFADALPHVPAHRKLPVLTQLVGTLGPAHFLWVLLLLLFKLHVERNAASDKEEAAACAEGDVQLWLSVCCEFEVREQLLSLVQVLKFLQQLPRDKDQDGGKRGGAVPKDGEERMEDLIFSVESHSGKELRHFQFLCVSFAAQLLGSARFVAKVSEGGDSADPPLQQLQQRLLEENLRYIHSVARCLEDHAHKPSAKFWRVLLNKTYDVLDKVNALLPTETFASVMKGLMGNQLPSVRRKAMELINNKLLHRTHWTPQQVSMFLDLIGDLLSIVGRCQEAEQEEEQGAGQEAEQAINRQTALYSLKLLCRAFGSAHPEAFLPVLQGALQVLSRPEEERNVVGGALLCAAEAVSALKARAIPHLPRLMPAVLQTVSDRKQPWTNETLALSAVAALQRVTETLPHFISPYLRRLTAQVCRLTHAAGSAPSPSPSAAQLSQRLASLRSTLATRLPPRVLLPNLTSCYADMVDGQQAHLAALMSILKEHVAHMEREELSSHQSELTSFFVSALDFRNTRCQGDLEKTWEIEGGAVDCLIAMVMKLSEVSFRPLFFKLLDWSKTGGAERLLTFYRLCDAVAARLKGLFVLFAGNLVQPVAELLRRTNRALTDQRLFEGGADGGGGAEEKNALLLRLLLDLLHKIFLYDSRRFLSDERGRTLMAPLLDQLENTEGAEPEYQLTVTRHLVPCVGQFCAALGDHAHWKTLNYQVLLKTRHQDAKVRFSSLLVLLELTSKLKENYLVLLPETIPFLAELMEDECDQVEQQVHKVVHEMENILGEPLQSYF